MPRPQDTRLQAERHHLPAGGARRRHRQGRRPDGRAAPFRGVPRLPRPRRRGDRARNPGPRHLRQRLLAQVGRGPRMAEGPSRLDDHFTPTSAAWMNAVEGFLSKLSRQRLKDAVFDSLDEWVSAIENHVEHHDAPLQRASAASSPDCRCLGQENPAAGPFPPFGLRLRYGNGRRCTSDWKWGMNQTTRQARKFVLPTPRYGTIMMPRAFVGQQGEAQ